MWWQFRLFLLYCPNLCKASANTRSSFVLIKEDPSYWVAIGILSTENRSPFNSMILFFFFQTHVQFATFSLLTLLQLRSIKKSVQFFHCVAHPKLPYFIGPDVTCRYTCYAPVSERNVDKVKVKKVKAKKVAASKMTRTTDKPISGALVYMTPSIGVASPLNTGARTQRAQATKKVAAHLAKNPKAEVGKPKPAESSKGKPMGFSNLTLRRFRAHFQWPLGCISCLWSLWIGTLSFCGPNKAI